MFEPKTARKPKEEMEGADNRKSVTAAAMTSNLTLFEKIAILDKIKSQPVNISHRLLAEIIKVPKSTISRLLQQQEKLREKWTIHDNESCAQTRVQTLCDQRPLFHCISIVLAICVVLIMLSQTSGSPILVQSSWLVTTAVLGHLIRDAAQNGFWICPLEPTPPLPYCVYITMICAFPYMIRLERVAKPQKHAFHNEGIQPEEELAKRGFSIYKGPGKQGGDTSLVGSLFDFLPMIHLFDVGVILPLNSLQLDVLQYRGAMESFLKSFL
uniref:Transmembrane protein 267 n=1 Tax=Timema cristinae TaxID=61476 RepID=A0A7R9GR90_TIMCR|nr:unnamed protein product [Timema cristinae]